MQKLYNIYQVAKQDDGVGRCTVEIFSKEKRRITVQLNEAGSVHRQQRNLCWIRDWHQHWRDCRKQAEGRR